jgi:hypothetical protein
MTLWTCQLTSHHWTFRSEISTELKYRMTKNCATLKQVPLVLTYHKLLTTRNSRVLKTSTCTMSYLPCTGHSGHACILSPCIRWQGRMSAVERHVPCTGHSAHACIQHSRYRLLLRHRTWSMYLPCCMAVTAIGQNDHTAGTRRTGHVVRTLQMAARTTCTVWVPCVWLMSTVLPYIL